MLYGGLEVLKAPQRVIGGAMVEGSGGRKAHEIFWPFYIWRTNK